MVLRTPSVCAAGEVPTSLALETTPMGPVAYVGLWRPAAPVEGAWMPSRGRVLAVDAQRGATLAALPLDGVPNALLLALGPDRIRRLYCIEALPEPSEDEWSNERRLWGLDPATLAVLDVQSLPYPPSELALAPEGDQAYSFVAASGPQFRRSLLRLDLLTGVETLLGYVPGATGASLVVTEDRIYAPNREGQSVWVGDRRGRPLKEVAVGQLPLGIAWRPPPPTGGWEEAHGPERPARPVAPPTLVPPPLATPAPTSATRLNSPEIPAPTSQTQMRGGV
jgi:hypothetical protein